jgi:hypothetical protein
MSNVELMQLLAWVKTEIRRDYEAGKIYNGRDQAMLLEGVERVRDALNDAENRAAEIREPGDY